MQTGTRTRSRLFAACTAALACTSLQAEPNPYYVGIAQAFSHESNLFRAATGQPEVGDTYSTTTLLGGLDQPISRQRLFADAAVRFNRYRDQDQLNNTGYSLSAGVDWETAGNLAGRIAYTGNQSLARFGADQGPVLTKKNLERDQEFVFNGRYGQASLLSLLASYTHRRLDYSAPEYAFQEFNQDTFGLGMQYRPSGLLTLGIGGRHTKGEYPFALQSSPGVFQPDDFDRNDLDLTAIWVPTGQSTISARLSYTKETHKAIASRDVSGGTGAIRWDYKPTGKLAFATEVIHDTGAEAIFTRLDQAGGSVQSSATNNNSQVSDSMLFRGTYDITAKVQAQLDARYVRRELVNTAALSSGASSVQSGSDKLGEIKFGLTYAPLRSVLLGCSYGYERRGASSAISYAYRASITTCSAQLKLQ